MVSHAFAALTKKRADLAGKEKGFTLIELLVVVIIIGVLAAIAIPIFLNVQGGAKENAVKSDLTSAKTAVVTAYTKSADSKMPVSLTAAGYAQPAADNYTVATTATPPLTYSTTANEFCITGKSATGKDFAIDASNSAREGTCGTGTGKIA